MNINSLHPEELLDRARDRALTEAEHSGLSEHVAICPACALHANIQIGLAADTTPTSEDHALAARLAAAVLKGEARSAAAAKAAGLPHKPGSERDRGAGRLRWVAIALLSTLATSAATAALWAPARRIVHRVVAFLPTAPEPADAPAKRRTGTRRQAPSGEIALVQAEPRVIAAPEPPTIPAMPWRSKPHRSSLAEAAPPAEIPAPADDTGAASLFASIARARTSANLSEATAAYRDLQTRYLDSREERTARVVLARVALDQAGAAGAQQAIPLFERYLASEPGGVLAEESRLGRGIALERLGRGDDERRAWQDFLLHHPNSVHAARARLRLAALH